MRRALLTPFALLALTHCSPPPPAADAAPDALDDAALDALPDTPPPDAPVDAPVVDPPGTDLPPISLGDLTLRAKTNGGFELVVGAAPSQRTLLASNFGPVAAQRYTENITANSGFWTFRRTAPSEVRPSAGATSRVDGEDLVLTVPEGAQSATLRFHRVNADVVTVVAGFTGAAMPFQSTALRFRCEANSHFLGFGQQFNDTDHRGRKFSLFVSEQGLGRDPARQTIFSGSHETTYFPLPFFLDPRGFGLLANTNARTLVDLCSTRADEYSLAPEQNTPITLRLYTGPTVRDVLRVWTDDTQGRSEAPPAWSVEGVWLGIQGGPDAVRMAYQRARTANVPVGAMWAQDWIGRKDLGFGNVDIRYHWTNDATWYPNLAALTAELRASNVRFLGYFNPFVLMDEDQFAEGRAMGFLPRDAAGEPYMFALPHGSGTMVDLTNPAAVTWFQGFANRAMDLGIVGWMQDYGEWLPLDARLSNGGNAREFHNAYPVEWHRAARDALRARHPDGDYIMFTRSGWIGEGRVAQVVWAGDQEASWSVHDGLPTVVPALTSMGIAGIGYVTHDIGGYYGGPSTAELYQRWIELGAFTPIMRTHEGLRRDFNWNWDRDAATIAFFSRFARIHAALAPEIIALGNEHRMTGMPIVRALPLEYPDDARTYAITDEYLLGPDLLVAPVVTQGQTARRVYFPRGTWFNVWNPSERIEGPVEREVQAPLGSPPVYSRNTARMDLAAIR